MSDVPQPSVLHVNDAAFTAQNMIVEATRRGYVWHYLPKAAPAQEWRGITGKARRAAIGGAWVARLRVQARRHDIVHVHSASTLAHSRLGAPRYVVHCHGTDVRVAQYDPARQRSIRDGLRDAEAVFYATPDLAEHVLPHRADAVYLPVPVDVDAAQPWRPADGRPRVVFASRWSPDKDGAHTDAGQLVVARALVEALGDRADVLGIDWGPQAAEAAAAGVRLLPRGDHADYMKLLSEAHVVIGQSTGMLGASELEALATGAPLVIAVPMPLYDDVRPPVRGGSVADAVAAVAALLDGSEPHDADGTRKWTRDQHGIEQAVDTVAAVHRDVVAARR
ncbi:glycosyltransferase family protein [Actinophytocola sp. KF-1]